MLHQLLRALTACFSLGLVGQEPPLRLDVTQTCDELGPVTVGLEQDHSFSK